jgi:hypothetical protein
LISIDTEALKREYLFANTASQLYRHFRENISVKSLSETEKLEALAEEYKARTQNNDRSIDEVVEAYAILMAITFYDYQDAIEAFKMFDLPRLEWGKALEDIYRRKSRITIYITKHGSPQELKEVSTLGEGTVNYKTLHGIPEVFDSDQTKSATSNTMTNKSFRGYKE